MNAIPMIPKISSQLTSCPQEATARVINLPDDDPHVLRVLVRYLYKNVLDATQAFSFSSSPHRRLGDSAFLIHIYAIADKYDVPALRKLALQRLVETCHPRRDERDFIGALRVVDECAWSMSARLMTPSGVFS